MPLSPADLDRDLTAYFARGLSTSRDDGVFDDAVFSELALRVFAYQFETLPPYRTYCQRRSALPQRLRHWTEIPAVPVSAFKDTRLQCEEDGGLGEPARVFRTSGTTEGGQPGEHYMTGAALQLYEASLVPAFRAFVLPDMPAGSKAGLDLIVLGPEPAEAPHSSLWHMVEVVGRELFDGPAHFFMRNGVLDATGAWARLAQSASAGRRVCLVTTDLALDRFLDAPEAARRNVRLAPGSRLVHTGGSKGRKREIATEALYARVEAALAIPDSSCVNEYGMTELASQFYDDVLRAPAATPAATPSATPAGSTAPSPRLKHGPPWVRVRIVDVHTLEPVPDGTPGLLHIVDLANRGSVLALLTEDRAVMDAESDPSRPGSGAFRLVGRARGSEARGCSLEFEEVPAT